MTGSRAVVPRSFFESKAAVPRADVAYFTAFGDERFCAGQERESASMPTATPTALGDMILTASANADSFCLSASAAQAEEATATSPASLQSIAEAGPLAEMFRLRTSEESSLRFCLDNQVGRLAPTRTHFLPFSEENYIASQETATPKALTDMVAETARVTPSSHFCHTSWGLAGAHFSPFLAVQAEKNIAGCRGGATPAALIDMARPVLGFYM